VVSSKTSTTELNYIMNPQSSQGDGREISTDVSWMNQGGGGETSFCDKSAAVDGTSNKICAA